MPNYKDPNLDQGAVAFQLQTPPRTHRKWDKIRDAHASALDALTVGPRSMGYVEFIAGRPADTEEMTLGATRIYWDGGTPDPTADISVDISATVSLQEDLEALRDAVAAYEPRDFDVWVLPNNIGFGVWLADEPDNTYGIDVAGTANAVRGAATLLYGMERAGLGWGGQYEVTAEDVALWAGGEAAPIGVFPYQGPDLRVVAITMLSATGAMIVPDPAIEFTVAQVAIDGTDRYWVLYANDTGAVVPLAATDLIGFIVGAE